MKIDKLYLEVNNDEVEVGRSRLGFGFRSVSTLNERPVMCICVVITKTKCQFHNTSSLGTGLLLTQTSLDTCIA